MIGPYSYWQAALLMHSADLDDMREALCDDGPHDALGHMCRDRALATERAPDRADLRDAA